MTFQDEIAARLQENRENTELQTASLAFFRLSHAAKYSYNFSWLGRPIIQYPQDLMAMQQIVWQVQPDLIIETGIAHGGSLIFYASLLELNAACGGPVGGVVVGIDNEIRPHNRAAIEAHPLAKRIQLYEGDSVTRGTVFACIVGIDEIQTRRRRLARVIICLDSHHTHDHVLAELEAYAPFVSIGSYIVVFDTIIEQLPKPEDREWGPGNSPATAVRAFRERHPEFEVDQAIDDALVLSANPGGYLRRMR